MSDFNNYGHKIHPNLPPCVKCGCDDYVTLLFVLGFGEKIQYRCQSCGIHLVYRTNGSPRVLAWVTEPDEKRNWEVLKSYFNEVQKYRDGKISVMPSRPPEIQVHIFENGVWHKQF